MYKFFYFLSFILFFTGCELITIGTRQVNVSDNIFDYNQKSSIGTIFLFKIELDSNNVSAASDLIAKEDGTKYLAIERYEKYYDIFRMKRMMNNKVLTDYYVDSLANNKMKYDMEINYRKILSFTTIKINNLWFISEMGKYE